MGLVTVIALGPLTNVAMAFRMDPQLWHSKVKRIVFMGGTVSGCGNMKPWTEANIGYDPEAAHVVLTSGLHLLTYPYDVFLKVAFSAKDLEGLGLQDLDGGAQVDRSDSRRRPWSELASRFFTGRCGILERDRHVLVMQVLLSQLFCQT